MTLTGNDISIQYPDEYHVRGPYPSGKLILNFCVKLEGFMSPEIKQTQQAWPSGSYCIFKMGDTCPKGNSYKEVKVDTNTVSIIALSYT